MEKISLRERFQHVAEHPIRTMLVAICVIIIGFVIAHDISEGYDNDIWFILANGKEILANGIPYENPFSAISGMGIVIQQWLYSVIAWLAYSVGGWTGLSVLLTVNISLMLVAMWLVACVSAGHRVGVLTYVVGVLLVIMSLSAYISLRPQVVTMALAFLVLCVMEAYRHTNEERILLLLLPIVLVHMNAHMSMLALDVAIVACYLVPDASFWRGVWMLGHNLMGAVFDTDTMLGRRKAHHFGFDGDGYDRRPILLVILMMLIVACVNPYGINGVTYLLDSYNAADYGGYINEMGLLTPLKSTWGKVLIIDIIVACVIIGRRGRYHIDMPLTLMLAGTCVASLQHVRNVWLFPMFVFVMFVKSVDLDRDGKPFPVNSVTMLWSGLFTAMAGVVFVASIIGGVASMSDVTYADDMTQVTTTDSTSTPSSAMSLLNARYGENERRNVNVFCMFNDGGYVEFNGYKVSMDPRPELWQYAISGQGNIYSDYVDATGDSGMTKMRELLGLSRYDYVIANTGSTLESAVLADGRYQVVLHGKGYQLYERTSESVTNMS